MSDSNSMLPTRINALSLSEVTPDLLIAIYRAICIFSNMHIGTSEYPCRQLIW